MQRKRLWPARLTPEARFVQEAGILRKSDASFSSRRRAAQVCVAPRLRDRTRGLHLLELRDEDFAAMLRGDPVVRAGLTQPPGGVDDPEVLAHVRRLAAGLRRAGYPGGQWMMIAGGEVVGLCGFKAPPSRGEVEIGYGVAASRRRRGYASAAVAAIVAVARRSAVQTILAATVAGNIASQRVLQRNGFEPAGTCADPDDGDLLLWRKVVSSST